MATDPPATAPAPDVVDCGNAEHYAWGGVCDGWHLLRDAGLSVIRERVPPGAAEVRHRHERAQQFFYVLSGEATLEFDAQTLTFGAGQGVAVAPGSAHRFVNRSAADVEFLVISSPSTRGDRVDLGEDA